MVCAVVFTLYAVCVLGLRAVDGLGMWVRPYLAHARETMLYITRSIHMSHFLAYII